MKQSILNSVKQRRLAFTDSIDLITSRFLNIKDCKSVCLALGPYRNLTTLTASTLFLHPNCQVLNHAGCRIYGNRQVDFISEYTKDRFNRFIQFAIKISIKGQTGDMGGSITHSHAFFPTHTMNETFVKTGFGLQKEKIKCLFWKESLRTSNLIREKNINISNILEKDDRLRFLLPIRNPLDCALSNLKTGHVELFQGLNRDSSILEVIRAVLDEIHWVATLKEKHPNRFFYYFEYAISREMLVELANFLELDIDKDWLSKAQSVMISKSHYKHDRELQLIYREMLAKKFSKFPDLYSGLLAFTSDL